LVAKCEYYDQDLGEDLVWMRFQPI